MAAVILSGLVQNKTGIDSVLEHKPMAYRYLQGRGVHVQIVDKFDSTLTKRLTKKELSLPCFWYSKCM